MLKRVTRVHRAATVNERDERSAELYLYNTVCKKLPVWSPILWVIPIKPCLNSRCSAKALITVVFRVDGSGPFRRRFLKQIWVWGETWESETAAKQRNAASRGVSPFRFVVAWPLRCFASSWWKDWRDQHKQLLYTQKWYFSGKAVSSEATPKLLSIHFLVPIYMTKKTQPNPIHWPRRPPLFLR